jgi:hypothetical protein
MSFDELQNYATDSECYKNQKLKIRGLFCNILPSDQNVITTEFLIG